MLNIVIEASRGIAACWVFLFHLERPIGHWMIGAVADLGALGVPMFFVLSGYCIGSAAWNSAQRKEAASAFLRRRLLRIYPPLWGSMLVLIALPFLLGVLSAVHTGHYAPPPVDWAAISPAEWLGIATLTRVFFSHGQSLESAFTFFNAVYWTLAIEVQFYVVMYFALLLRKRSDVFLMIVSAAGCVLAFVPSAYTTGIFLPYWPLFAVGLGLFRLVKAGWVPATLGRHHTAIGMVMIAGLATALLMLIAHGTLKHLVNINPLLTFFLFGLGFAQFLWFALVIEPWLANQYKKGWAPVRHAIWITQIVGASSYSIYLLHGKLHALPAMFTRQVASGGSVSGLALTMGLTIVLACLFSTAIERRFARPRSNR